ncbi:hypothetical protein F0562_000102 [Nyssa sinensis]|uniref:Uncharacterized protein n=1 Tax=Nyssa sinensis TaxID=561372 RepID=A0A5J5BZK3_9ASTE|nr:hypothetical protein F0562_000102 [Nyssa sinensis]
MTILYKVSCLEIFGTACWSNLPSISHHFKPYMQVEKFGDAKTRGQLPYARNTYPKNYLVMILQGCKELVHFDVRDGRGFKVNDEILKLASHIRTFMYEGSREFEGGEGYDEHGYYFSPVYIDYSSDEELVNSDQLSGDGELVN